MPQKIIIAEQERIAALLTDGRVDKLIVAQCHYQIGDIYLGIIENVKPGIDAAFVNIGPSEKNGFLNVNDLGPLRSKQTAASINELLRPSQPVLVQVLKEPTGNKGPRLTGNISLPGRYLVLQPTGQGVNVSRQINTETERNRLKALGVLIKPPGTGLTVRSEAAEVTEELIIDDLENLLKKWELIQQTRDRANPPSLLSRDEDFIHRVLRDNTNSDLSEVIVETTEASDKAKRFLTPSNKNVTVECLSESVNLLQHYQIDIAILNALKPRVDLPSGGYIIIEPTEALTVIDVNSGSFASANSSETVLWTNCEAAIEIARQLKLRNIGGIIIVDFIDMDSRRDQLQLLEYFTSAIKDDSSRPKISQLTELGLVELTRKRQGQNIYELFSKECSACSGLGHISNIPQKNQIQPSALNLGLVESTPVLQNELSDSINLSKNVNRDNNLDQPIIKQEQIEIKMNEDEEYVFSSLGLNPTLMLDNQTNHENLSIQIIKAESHKKITTNKTEEKQSSSEIKKEKGNSRVFSSLEEDEESILDDSNKDNELVSDSSKQDEINNQIETSVELINSQSTSIDPESSEQDLEETRRRRRRSSAAN
ncbi:Cytoplasmic axial filament protein CafA and Ribonuclease G Ribonuclease E [Prochlorococcus marinus str. SS2]|uniref:Rne/Rng family ribonuclease n=1 Tax=Prochlorococcus marinus TaxID=1219 RepID=UPI0005337566|nr:Rne/Rng family ribonuclease [Prochlorococcus marinus]KGG20151.1 Cytoplasmic axial filament protein CafA and Ribonuclease G Ribonuclease E [Prochlorococcus marinus str. SS2]